MDEIAMAQPETREAVEELRIRLISKKGAISQLFAEFKDVPPS